MEVVGGIFIFILAIVVLVLITSIFSWATNTRITTRSGDTFTPDTFPTLVKAGKKGIEKITQGSLSKVNDLLSSFKDKDLTKIEKLERINKLYQSNSLTNEEFEVLKKGIIGYKPHQEPIQISSPKVNEFENVKLELEEYDIKEAITIINTLFFEYKEKLPILKNYEFPEIHKLIILNKQTVPLIKSYSGLFRLYTEGIINAKEFDEKKQQILYKSLNIERYGNV